MDDYTLVLFIHCCDFSLALVWRFSSAEEETLDAAEAIGADDTIARGETCIAGAVARVSTSPDVHKHRRRSKFPDTVGEEDGLDFKERLAQLQVTVPKRKAQGAAEVAPTTKKTVHLRLLAAQSLWDNPLAHFVPDGMMKQHELAWGRHGTNWSMTGTN